MAFLVRFEVLLVGNHQLFAADLGPLVREFLVAKGALPRGLAFPGAMRRAFGGAGGNGGAGDGRGPPLRLGASRGAELGPTRSPFFWGGLGFPTEIDFRKNRVPLV